MPVNMEGRILGNRYELIERIGGGGMAVVYKARCQLLNRYVAVKILREEFTNDEEFVKRFRIEAQAAASLSHPNIVSIYDVGCEDNIHYIVMECVDGITLKEYIAKKGALKWKEAANIAIQICSALEHAHKNHIVHRDIKPHNILLTGEGIAKVTDFGIARAVTSSTITMVGSTIGSVHYFSPEQARGGFTDEKSDLYSLGITIYEMVTGRVPFDGESPVAVALKHIQDKAARPVDLDASIPVSINNIIMKAIKKDQNSRYQSASEILADLQRALREPNSAVSDDSGGVEEFPTKKLKAVGDADYTRYDDEGDEEENHTNRKKKDRLSVWLGVATGLIIMAVCFYIGIKIVIPAIMPEEAQDFIVQNYVNKDFSEVSDDLKKNDITAVEDNHVYSDSVDKGLIISQSVAENQTLKPGGSIKFVVSDGPEMVTIPDISGKETRIGDQELKDLGLKTSIDHENSDTVATGLIIRTAPAAQEEVKPGDTVTIIDSLGPLVQQVNMPDFTGLTRAQAEKLINDKKLSIGKILPEGVVNDVAKIVKQYPLANTLVDEGTAVDLTYGVEETSSTGTGGDNTGTGGNSSTTAGDNGGAAGGSGNTGDNKLTSVEMKVTLDNPDKYGDEIQVYIEATPSDTNELYIVTNQKVKKSDFPITVNIPKSQGGTTHVVVKFDGALVQEGDY